MKIFTFKINRAFETKKKLFTLFFALSTTIGTILASDTQVDGIWYNFNNETGTAEVTYRGPKSGTYSNEYTGSVVIPSSIEYNSVTYNVTKIGNQAFSGCPGLTSIEIPNSVTSIGTYAFASCTGLTSITIPNSITSIGDGALSSCYSLTSVTINSNAIVSKTFTSSSSMKDIFGEYIEKYIIGDSVTSIGKYAFYDCSNLTSVTIGNNVTSIGDYAFDGCALTSITIPNSVTSVGKSAFASCTNLESATIGNSVTSIGDYAFSGCSGLTSIEIPNSVTSIGWDAFHNCSSLASVTIGTSVTSIGNYAFDGCSSLTNVTLNSNTIANQTYTSSSNMQHIFGEQVEEYIIGDCVTSIGDSAFYACTNLTSVTIGINVTRIGDYAFYGCEGIQNVVWNAKNCANSGYFDTQVESFIFGDEVETIPAECCYNICGLTSIEIPNSVTSIGDNAFAECIYLTNVTIGNNVTSIGEWAFSWCYSLPIIDNIRYADTYLVEGVNNKSKYTIKDGTKWIGNGAFIGSYYPTEEIIIPSSVISIGSYAFEYNDITLVSCLGSTPPALSDSAFYECTLHTISVPCDAVSTYKGDIGWQEVADYIKGDCPTYTIRFVDWDGFLLQSSEVEEGELPEYTGWTPTRSDDEEYTYTFNGWTPEIVAATADATYTATYTATPHSQGLESVTSDITLQKILNDGHLLILRGDKVYTVDGREVR